MGTETSLALCSFQLPAVTGHPLAHRHPTPIPTPAHASQAGPSPSPQPSACSSCCSSSLAVCIHPSLEHSPSPSHSVAQVSLELMPQPPECWGFKTPPRPGSIFCVVYLNSNRAFSLPIMTQPPGPGAWLLVVLVRCEWGWVHPQNLTKETKAGKCTTELSEESPNTQDLVSKRQKASLLSVLPLIAVSPLPGQAASSQRFSVHQLSAPSAHTLHKMHRARPRPLCARASGCCCGN